MLNRIWLGKHKLFMRIAKYDRDIENRHSHVQEEKGTFDKTKSFRRSNVSFAEVVKGKNVPVLEEPSAVGRKDHGSALLKDKVSNAITGKKFEKDAEAIGPLEKSNPMGLAQSSPVDGTLVS
ncbi:hypothetical protein L1887_39095 [Cichorium endivia]|nr:hypothetical protein L1887_39095 [Cichorium endivia]